MAKKEGYTLKQKANLARGHKIVTSPEPGRAEWWDIQVSMQRLINDSGKEAVAAMNDEDLQAAMLTVGRMNCPLPHTKTMRELLVKEKADG